MIVAPARIDSLIFAGSTVLVTQTSFVVPSSMRMDLTFSYTVMHVPRKLFDLDDPIVAI
jgi:hypothetical protein